MQLSYPDRNPVARAGLPGDLFSPRIVESRVCNGLVQAGRGAFRVPVTGLAGSNFLDPGECYQVPTAGDAADVDAILASGGASALTDQVWEGSELNGVVGAGLLHQPRLITLALSSHANWDATNATLRYENSQGQIVTETLAIPDAGAVTVTSVGYARRVISLAIPAQSGTAGTFTIGIAALDGTVNLADFDGVAIYEPVKEPASPGVAEFGDGQLVSLMQLGSIWCLCEMAMAVTDTVYVRTVVGGLGLGAFRNSAGSSEAVAVTGAKVLQYALVNGEHLAKIRFPG